MTADNTRLERLTRIVSLRAPEDLVRLADEVDRAGLPAFADKIDAELEARAADPERGLSDMPTPALEDIPTQIGPKSEPEPLPLSTREPLGKVPTIDDVMEAIKGQSPIEPQDLQGMDAKTLEFLRARLGIVMNVVEKALGKEPTLLISPEEQEEREEAETMRGTFSRPGAATPPLSKRAEEEGEDADITPLNGLGNN